MDQEPSRNISMSKVATLVLLGAVQFGVLGFGVGNASAQEICLPPADDGTGQLPPDDCIPADPSPPGPPGPSHPPGPIPNPPAEDP